MSKNNKKNTKTKKQMNPRTKENLLLGFRSILSNDACYDLGHTRPWYAAVIVFILSTIIALIPTFTTYMTVSGGTMLTTNSYGYEVGLAHFQNDSDDDSYAISSYLSTLDSDGTLSMTREKWVEFTTAYNANLNASRPEESQLDDWHWYRHINSNTGNVDFQVFYCEFSGSELSSYASSIIAIAGASASTSSWTMPTYEAIAGLNPTDSPIYAVNTLILGEDGFRIFKYNSAGSLSAGGYGVNFKYPANEDLPFYEMSIPQAEDYATDMDYAEAYYRYVNGVTHVWSEYFDLAYRDYKNMTAWVQTGIMAAVFVGFPAFMGLLVFLMTRGKNNPFRIINAWHSQKIVYWACFTPAILQLILGFAFGVSSIMAYAYIFLVGMRIMWMSMRTLSPNRQ